MVWQLPLVQRGGKASSDSQIVEKGDINVDIHKKEITEARPGSRTSSSVDLGPTPGSGVVTIDSGEEDGLEDKAQWGSGAEPSSLAPLEAFEPVNPDPGVAEGDEPQR